jgi:hypothetical protein
MTNELYDQNAEQLKELLDGPLNIERYIDSFERTAIDMGDLKRAIKYNWLRNAYKQGRLDDDYVFLQLMTIHADLYVEKTVA